MATANTFDIKELERRMRVSLDTLKRELGGLRTGRASAALLEPVQVNLYGQRMPLNQVGTVSVPEPRMLSIQVWDKSAVPHVDKAIREANLGLNPIGEGATLRVPIPELNAERRKELVKVAHKYAEQAKVAVRHVRRDGLDGLKKEEKDGGMGEDQQKSLADQIQKMTDGAIAEIDQILAQKEAEITHI